MKNLVCLSRYIKSRFVVMMLMFLSTNIFAANIFIPLESVSELGEGRAGGAAIAEDAATNFYNAAGLTRVDHQQLIVLAMVPYTHQYYNGTMSNPGTTVPLGGGFFINSPIFSTGHTSTSTAAVLPYFHYTIPINNRWHFGVSLLSLYGLGINYPINSIVRYEVNRAYDKSYDLSPSLAFRINPKLSVGIGVDIVYFGLSERNAVRTQPLTTNDSILLNQASAITPGWHAGILYEFTPATRVGLSYRSQIITHLSGSSKFYSGSAAFPFPALPNARTSNFTVTMPLASQTTLSIYHDVSSCWAIMGSIEYQNWGIYRSDHANHVASPTGPIDEIIPRNFRNTWFFALGSRYQLAKQWLVRGGLTYSEGSTTTGSRDVLIVDPNQIGVDIGLRYIQNCKLTWDVGYGYSFPVKVPIHYINPVTQNNLEGNVDYHTEVFGVEATWNIT